MQQNKAAQGVIRGILLAQILGWFVIDCHGTTGSDAQKLARCPEVGNPLTSVQGCELVIIPAACVDCFLIVSHGLFPCLDD